MPAIRDFIWTYEATTTDAGVSIPMCNYQAGDLLLVLAMADTGAGTWSCTGYTQLFQVNNTISSVCYWKIAGANEADVVVGNTVVETYNGCVIAIRDVDPINPFGNPSVFNAVAQGAANKFAMQQITTNRANALCLAVSFSSVTGIPSLIENGVTGLFAADGAAEGMGVGWFMQRTAGLTPNNILCSNLLSGAGVKAVIQVVGPSGGATVIPTYCVSDASILIDYLHGVTGYNGNIAIAATADTGFGTTIGTRTANDASIGGSADVGINSFHSFARFTNVISATAISGGEMVTSAANRFNFSSKNLLSHVRPQTPGSYQRLAPITSPGRGVLMGVRSNIASGGATTGWKVWKVHGTGTNWPLDATLPIIINNGAGNTVGTSGTLDANVITSVGFWISGLGDLQTSVEFGPIWLLDTTVIAGGNATEPVNIPGIVMAAALGHERLSSIQQGNAQMLCLQNIQFGDGGTNGIYLDLNSTSIEFPEQYNLASKNVFYNSIDNVCGLTYYAGASDTIKHRNSVIFSKSKYHWRIHPSSSGSATYDFSGLSIIGAGDVQLRQVTTFSKMLWNDCLTITQNGAALDNCSFTNCTLTATTLANLTNNDFIAGATGHAIIITTPGSYSFSGNNFSGYGANGTVNAAIYNNSGGAIIINILNGGSTPTIRNGVGASTTINNAVTLQLTNLVAGSRVYVRNTTDGIDLYNEVEATATFTKSINFTGNKNLLLRIRNASGVTKYKPYETTGILTSNGFSAVINQVIDE